MAAARTKDTTYLGARYSGLLTEIRESGKLDEDALKAALAGRQIAEK